MRGAAALAPEAEAIAALSQEAEAADALTREAEATVIAGAGAQDRDLLLSHDHLLKQDHHPDPSHLVLLLRATSPLAGALPGAKVCPDLILPQKLSESDRALETFRNVWLELNDCRMDCEQHSVLK